MDAMTDFQRLDDKITEEINALIDNLAIDLHNIADSYGVHVRPESARELLDVAAKFKALAG